MGGSRQGLSKAPCRWPAVPTESSPAAAHAPCWLPCSTKQHSLSARSRRCFCTETQGIQRAAQGCGGIASRSLSPRWSRLCGPLTRRTCLLFMLSVKTQTLTEQNVINLKQNHTHLINQKMKTGGGVKREVAGYRASCVFCATVQHTF